MISQKFLNALKQTGVPYHKLAWEAGITPGQLYRITSGVDRPRPDDPRIKALCEYLRISVDEAFEPGDLGNA